VKKLKTTLLRRCGAMLYDALLVFAIMALFTVPFVAMEGGELVEPGTTAHQVAVFGAMYLFFVYFWTHGGQTLGMRAWRLRLETKSGSVPGIGIASIRFLLALISLLLFGFGFLWQLWDKDRLTLHDRLSGTQVMYYPKQ